MLTDDFLITDLFNASFFDLEEVGEVAMEHDVERADCRLLAEVVDDDVLTRPRPT
jgi:hypothetical protein